MPPQFFTPCLLFVLLQYRILSALLKSTPEQGWGGRGRGKKKTELGESYKDQSPTPSPAQDPESLHRWLFVNPDLTHINSNYLV